MRKDDSIESIIYSILKIHEWLNKVLQFIHIAINMVPTKSSINPSLTVDYLISLFQLNLVITNSMVLSKIALYN